MSKYLITTANVFIPAKIRYTNISSTYLPADILNKMLKSFGEESQMIAGVDVFGKQAYRAMRHIKDRNKYIADCKKEFRQTLSLFGIEPDLYIDSDNPKMDKFVNYSVAQLYKNGLLLETQDHSFYCNDCQEELSKSECEITSQKEGRLKKHDSIEELLEEDFICKLCGSDNIEIRQDRQWGLLLPRTEFLVSLIKQQDMTSNIIPNIQNIYNKDFDCWTFTRNNYGRSMPLDREKSIYLWYDSMVSKLLAVSSEPENVAHDIKDVKMISYFGKNILPYYSLMMPTIFNQGFNVSEFNIKFAARGFCLTQDNDASILMQDKFTSDELDKVRLFIASRVPDKIKDYKLTEDSYKQFLNGTYKNFKKYFHRLSDFESNSCVNSQSEEYKTIKKYLKEGRVNKILSTIEQWAIDDMKTLAKGNYDVNAIKNRYAIISTAMSAVAPNLIRENNNTHQQDSVNNVFMEKFNDHTR